MEHGTAHVRREDLGAERAREVEDDRPRIRPDARRDLGDGPVGNCEHEGVDAIGRARQAVVAPEQREHGPTGGAEGAGERTAGAPGADDADGGHWFLLQRSGPSRRVPVAYGDLDSSVPAGRTSPSAASRVADGTRSGARSASGART